MNSTFWLFAFLLLVSCASQYNPIRPSSQNYQNRTTTEGVTFSYKYGVLAEGRNKKYAKREDRNGIRLISIEIDNTSSKDLRVGRDLLFYSGEKELKPVDQSEVHKVLKQGVPIYLLYLLLTPTTITSSSGNATTNVFPIGLLLGPGITLGNMLSASSSNKYFRHELEEYNLIGKSIPAGTKVYGLMGVYDLGYNPINIKLTSK